MPPLASPISHRAARINEMIDIYLKDQLSQDDSTLQGTTLNAFGFNKSSYNLAAHKVKPIMHAVFKGLFKKEEKQSLVVLRIFDLFIAKGAPEI